MIEFHNIEMVKNKIENKVIAISSIMLIMCIFYITTLICTYLYYDISFIQIVSFHFILIILGIFFHKLGISYKILKMPLISMEWSSDTVEVFDLTNDRLDSNLTFEKALFILLCLFLPYLFFYQGTYYYKFNHRFSYKFKDKEEAERLYNNYYSIIDNDNSDMDKINFNILYYIKDNHIELYDKIKKES